MDAAVRCRPDRRRSLRGRVTWAVVVLAVAVAGCGPHVGTTASSFLRRIREDADPNVRYLAYAKLGTENCYEDEAQKDEATRLLVERLAKGREPVATRAVICRTLGALGRPSAREAILKAVNDPDAVVRVEACRALGRVGITEDATILARIMATDTLEDCRVAAIEALGELKADDPRIGPLLVDAMVEGDPAIRLASLNALRAITGRDLGVEPGPWMTLVSKDAPRPPAATGPEAAPGGDLPIVLAPGEAAPGRDPQTRPAAYPPPIPPYRLPGEGR